jgi:hypothetical protein
MKEKYIAPELTSVSFVVEQGFVGSVQGSPVNVLFLISNGGSEDLNKAGSYENEQDWTW